MNPDFWGDQALSGRLPQIIGRKNSKKRPALDGWVLAGWEIEAPLTGPIRTALFIRPGPPRRASITPPNSGADLELFKHWERLKKLQLRRRLPTISSTQIKVSSVWLLMEEFLGALPIHKGFCDWLRRETPELIALRG